MAINMNSIPTEKPSMNTIFPKGCYQATIVKAEMKQGKNETKPPYFSAECDIVDPVSGTNMGKFWIPLYDSEAQLCRYQIGRFIKALNLNIKGEFELKDLTKMVNGKSLLVDICPEDKPDPQWNIIDISAECFYPLEDKKTTKEAQDELAEEIEETFSAPPQAPAEEPAPKKSANY